MPPVQGRRSTVLESERCWCRCPGSSSTRPFVSPRRPINSSESRQWEWPRRFIDSSESRQSGWPRRPINSSESRQSECRRLVSLTLLIKSWSLEVFVWSRPQTPSNSDKSEHDVWKHMKEGENFSGKWEWKPPWKEVRIFFGAWVKKIHWQREWNNMTRQETCISSSSK